MKISTRGRYGLMAMEILKDNYNIQNISVKTIATEKNISEAYLEQLFSLMKNSGLVVSTRGAQGGYKLSRPPEEITIGEILNSLEGDMELSCCDGETYECESASGTCRMKSVLDKIESGINQVTESITLAEL